MTQLFMCSTPLHILNSIAIASQTPDDDHHIWLIDQPDVSANPYFELLKHWQGTPFNGSRIFQGQVKGVIEKLQIRKRTFADIEQAVYELRPETIYTGNDRRIEFQYAMHQCALLRCNTKGTYMDEGTFTYVGRSASTSFSDEVIDNLLKKVTYGFWWKHPPTIGGSDWIDDVYAAFPELVHSELKEKTIHPLQACFQHNAAIDDFCRQLIEWFGADEEHIRSLDAVITLPHESIISRLPGYYDAMQSVLVTLTERGLKTGVKLHPRNQNPDLLSLDAFPDTYRIPHRVPFEALLPLLPPAPLIIGDVSSSLINSRWLKPESRILSLQNQTFAESHVFERFFSQIGVQTQTLETLLRNVEEWTGTARG